MFRGQASIRLVNSLVRSLQVEFIWVSGAHTSNKYSGVQCYIASQIDTSATFTVKVQHSYAISRVSKANKRQGKTVSSVGTEMAWKTEQFLPGAKL